MFASLRVLNSGSKVGPVGSTPFTGENAGLRPRQIDPVTSQEILNV
jgi:hypothetical protein